MSPPSGLVCPMCGAANKMESVFCLSCGARLVPLTAAPAPEKPQPIPLPIKGLSLPARESPGELPAEFQKIEAASVPPTTEEKKDKASWIDHLRATPPADKTPDAEEDVPDWLKSAQPTADAKPQAQQELTPTEIPDWLQKLRPAEEQPVDAVIEDTQMPDWLKTASQEEATPPTPSPVAPVEIAAESEPTQPVIAEPVVPLATAEEIPAWLNEHRSPPIETAEPARVEETFAVPLVESVETETAAESDTAHVENREGPIQTDLTPSEESKEDIPDWLRTLPAAPTIGAEPTLGIQPASPDEVPDWLASLKTATQLGEDETVETSGPLEGLRGVLPLAVAITEPHAISKAVTVPSKNDGGALFESILATPRPASSSPSVAIKRRVWTMRPLVYLLIALAAIIPFFIPSDLASSALPISGTPAAEFYDTLQALPVNSTVLVSFDYDASQSGEMDLQANAILRHLIQRRIKIITLSTLDTGAPLAKRILDNVTQNLTGYSYGANYINLGYLPGHETGLLQLATSGFPVTARDFVQSQGLNSFAGFANVKTLRDVALVIEFAGSEDVLKNWMEQVQPRTSVKIVAGVSASVEPKATVYHAPGANQLTAMVSGAVGAAQYEILTNQPGLALVSINAQSAAQLMLVFIIVLGNIALLFSRGRKQNV